MLSFAPFEDVCRLEAKSCHIVIVYVPPEEIETVINMVFQAGIRFFLFGKVHWSLTALL